MCSSIASSASCIFFHAKDDRIVLLSMVDLEINANLTCNTAEVTGIRTGVVTAVTVTVTQEVMAVATVETACLT